MVVVAQLQKASKMQDKQFQSLTLQKLTQNSTVHCKNVNFFLIFKGAIGL